MPGSAHSCHVCGLFGRARRATLHPWAPTSQSTSMCRARWTIRGSVRVPENVVAHYGPPLHPDDLQLVDGVPVTSVARTLIDLAEVMDADELRGCFRAARDRGLLRSRSARWWVWRLASSLASRPTSPWHPRSGRCLGASLAGSQAGIVRERADRRRDRPDPRPDSFHRRLQPAGPAVRLSRHPAQADARSTGALSGRRSRPLVAALCFALRETG
jgi:hypothetical protein